MALESTTTIAGLINTNPTTSDPVSQGDDHIVLIKNVLKTIFPGVGGSGFATPLTATEAELNFVHGVTSAIQAQINAAVLATTNLNTAIQAALQAQTYTAWTTGGTSTAYTLTPTPAITAYTAPLQFSVRFNAASGAAPTLQVSGVISPPLLKQYTPAGTKVAAVIYANQVSDVQFDGTDWVVLDAITISDTETITSPVFAGTPTGVGVLTSMGVQTASGTAVTFSGIPDWAKRITVMMSGISTASTGVTTLRLGTAGGIEITGYASWIQSVAASSTNGSLSATSGFEVETTGAAGRALRGHVIINKVNGNVWEIAGQFNDSVSTMMILAGDKTLAAALTQLVLTTTGGTDTFDAGTINVMYE